MQSWKTTVVYVTRIERAGIRPDTPGYFIISNYTRLAIRPKGKKMFYWLKKKAVRYGGFAMSLNTRILVATLGRILSLNQPQIEKICADNGVIVEPAAE